MEDLPRIYNGGPVDEEDDGAGIADADDEGGGDGHDDCYDDGDGDGDATLLLMMLLAGPRVAVAEPRETSQSGFHFH